MKNLLHINFQKWKVDKLMKQVMLKVREDKAPTEREDKVLIKRVVHKNEVELMTILLTDKN